ncbi:hypothetical protein GT360_02530 [Vibrio astriarenae]|uniref:YbaK/aminoacyl-tRNA synthetase-associated domain-containing protein n=1 Tax=Vibrio astriarenae TaxID=1481923 RepID=A0A7Z2YCN0_9VIBR|nr:YbaK/EbsC family protein [Vibrio astriarenae]QIA62461.1 hypothetical protein GT360_02530 [Vibrio astriarenae]
MMSKINTPIIDLLIKKNIPFKLLEQQVETISIEDTAHARGISPNQMVKSILLRDMGNRYALACVPGDLSVDPKKVRAILNWRRMTCVGLDQLQTTTGYQVGCVAPLLLKQPMPIVFDNQLTQLQHVTISSGQRLAGIALSSQDLVELCQPRLGDICR